MGHSVRTAFRRIEAKVGRPLRVLAYHRVAAGACDPWAMTVSPTNFEQQLEVLATGGEILPVGMALSTRAARRPGRTHRFVLTFDDGYSDNLTHALPLLERHDAPATVFIATQFIDQAYFWWDRLAAIVLDPGCDVARSVSAARQVQLLSQPDADALAASPPDVVHEHLYRSLAPRAFDDRTRRIDEMADALRAAPPQDADRPLTSEQLTDLAAHPLITIGSHTHGHPRLTDLAGDVALGEIVEGDRQLDDLIGPGPRPFAYPHGAASRSLAELVRRAGHECAFTTEPRPASVLDSPLLLPRIATSDIAGDDFRARRGL